MAKEAGASDHQREGLEINQEATISPKQGGTTFRHSFPSRQACPPKRWLSGQLNQFCKPGRKKK